MPDRIFSLPWTLCLAHVIWTERRMTNLALNVCFDFFSRHEEQKIKDNNNKYLTFNTNFDIQHSVQMT